MSDEDKIQKFFRSYFTQAKIKQDFAQKILKQSEQFNTKNRPRQFLDRFFDSLKKSFDSKNPKSFVTACKRFLFIINKLLGTQVRKEKQGKYNELISQSIVRYYLFFFEIIFKHSLHELIVELKMYRMRWVKLISDLAFINLRQEIKKKHNNFNLDRGFSEENMLKLKKIHEKRGLTSKQSNFYLGLNENQEQKKDAYEKHKNQSSSSESDGDGKEHQNVHKKMKPDYSSQYASNYPDSGYSTYGSFHPGYISNPPSYESQPFQTFADPRVRKPSYNQPSYPQNIYPPMAGAYPHEKASLESTPLTTPSVYSISPSRGHPSYFSYQSYPNQPESHRPPINYEFKEVPEQRRVETHFSILQKILCIRKELTQNLFKCRQCGQCFETGENHQKHMNDHFFASLDKVNEAQLKGKIKKESKVKLLDLKSWEFVEKPAEKEDYKFEVLLSEIPEQREPNVHCYFCNEQMEITFSSKYEDWVLTDAIKINDEGKVDIIHFGCYQSFKSDQNSQASE